MPKKKTKKRTKTKKVLVKKDKKPQSKPPIEGFEFLEGEVVLKKRFHPLIKNFKIFNYRDLKIEGVEYIEIMHYPGIYFKKDMFIFKNVFAKVEK
jgi:hypothetical protein